MSWQSYQLGDVITLKRGHDLPEQLRQNGDIPVVSSSGITGYHKVPKASAPGVVTGRYGTLGEVFYMTQDYWPLNTALYVTDFKGNDPRFVAYFLKNVLKNFQSDKAAVPGIDRNVLHGIKVRIPNSTCQVRISEVLSAYDNLIENNQRRIALLEESARLLYNEWFVRLQFPGYEHTPIIDGVPDKWKHSIVNDFGKVITGKTPSTNDADNFGSFIPFIKTPDMHASSIVMFSEEYLSEKGSNTQKNKILPPNSILVACIGAKLGVVSLNGLVSQTNQQINGIVPNNECYTYYAYFTLKQFREKLLAIGGGATMPNVNKTKFESMPVIIPEHNLLESYHEIVKNNFEQIKTLILINKKLETARNLLLPRLMSGEITV